MRKATLIMAAIAACWLVAACSDDGDGGRSSDPVLGGLRVKLEPEPARLTLLDPEGRVLLEGLLGGSVSQGDAPNVAAAFRSAEAEYEMMFGSFKITEAAAAWQGVTGFGPVTRAPGKLACDLLGPEGRVGAAEVIERGEGIVQVRFTGDAGNRATAAFRCRPDEHFLGFGEQTHDVDHRGQTVPIWVSEQGITKRDDDEITDQWMVEGRRHTSYFPIPFFVSSAGYGILADTYRRSLFAMCSEAEDAWRVEAWEGTLSFHVFHGPAPLEVIQKHGEVVGRAPVPPPVVFAPWNDAIYGEDNVRRVAQKIRDEGIPSSVIWSEDWGGARTVGDNYELDQNWTLDPEVYPDATGLARHLSDLGIFWYGYFNTFLTEGNDHWEPAQQNGYWIHEQTRQGIEPYHFQGVRFEKTSLVDLTNPDAKSWMQGYMEAALDIGFRGWMADYAEWLPADSVLHSGEDAREVHNQYPLLWQRMNEELLASRPDERDLIVFVRSGFTGSQGISHQVVWAGDQSTDFAHGDGLPTIIPMGIGLGVSGFPYYGHDIAGYMSQGTQPSTKELFFRWTTLGALSPIMRTHHGHSAYANWSFESDADTIAHYRRWATLHIQLYPWFLKQAELAAETGAPIFRAVALNYPDDERAWGLKYQYMLGPDILVAPVVTQGTISREMYFPAGQWIPLLGGEPTTGPTAATVEAVLTEIPAYVRSGAVIAMLPDDVQTLVPAQDGIKDLSDCGDDREVRAYLGADGLFEESAGSSYTLTSEREPAGPLSLTWKGTALSACDPDTPVAPCGSADASSRMAAARVTGDGTLALSDGSGEAATLVTAGGKSGRQLVLRLLW